MMTRPKAAARSASLPFLDLAFAGGSTAVFLVITGGLIKAMSLYLR